MNEIRGAARKKINEREMHWLLNGKREGKSEVICSDFDSQIGFFVCSSAAIVTITFKFTSSSNCKFGKFIHFTGMSLLAGSTNRKVRYSTGNLNFHHAMVIIQGFRIE